MLSASCCTQMLCASCSAQASCSVQMLCASCSAQTLCVCALRKLVCASCSAPVAPCKRFAHVCKLLCVSKLLCTSALRQLLRASALHMCSMQIGLCKLLYTSVLRNCSVQVALCKLLCASCSAQVTLRKLLCANAAGTGNILRVLFLYLKVTISQPELHLHLKVAIFQPELQEHAPRTTFVFKSCDFQAGAAAEIEPVIAELRKQARKPRDNFQRPFYEQEKSTAPQRERFDTHNLRKGLVETETNSHGATARALQRARSPQRVARGPQKS